MTTISWAIAVAAWAAFTPVVVPHDSGPKVEERVSVTDLMLAPESRLRVEGTSTVRGYTCNAKEIGGVVQIAPDVSQVKIPALGAAVRGVELEIPIGALDCGNGTMNDHMRKALQAKDNPTIRFRVASHEVTVTEGGKARIEMAGDLTIAGTTKRITLSAVATPGADGQIQIGGSKEIDMTEYGVAPPRLMMGTMKVHDRVVVHFDIALRQH